MAKNETTETNGNGEKMVTIMLHKDNNKDREDLFVGVNMQDYRIKRGEPVEVPESVAEVIKNKMAQENELFNYNETHKNVPLGNG